MALVPISKDNALMVLKKDRYKYLSGLVSLECNIPPVPKSLWGDKREPTSLMLVEHFPHGVFATLVGHSGQWLSDALEHLRHSFDSLTLGGFHTNLFEARELRDRFIVGPMRCTRSFVCTSPEAVPEPAVYAEKLVGSDREAFNRYPQKDGQSHPTLAQLFQWFVLDGRGEILAVREAGEILGYLICTKQYENIWDVVNIQVREERRGQGLGTRLAATYAHQKLQRGQIPYWSGAANEISERTAMKVGFWCCSELLHASISVQEA